MTRRATAVTVPALALILSACGGAAEIHELRGPTMGSSFRIKWHGGPDPAAARAALTAVLDQFDASFSLWRTDSELAQLNADGGTSVAPVTDRLRAALDLALRVAARSQGAFDPTVRPLSVLYQRRKRGEPVTDQQLAAAAARVDFRQLRLAPAGLERGRSGLELDLDGLVAGLCAEAVRDQLVAMGARGGMLDITGEVLCFGGRPDGAPWRIGVVDPDHGEGPPGAVATVALRDRALCTSGSYENFVENGGRLAHHVFDPRSGASVQNGVVSVSVLARSCALADALGTALMVLGPAGAEALLRDWPGEPEPAGALFVVQQPDGTLRTEKVHWPADG